MTEWAISLLGAYLVGSIPFGVLFSRWLSGLDPREHGSRNIGFSNVLRVSGWRSGILTLVGDFGKGFFPVVISRAIWGDSPIVLGTGLAAFLGHTHSLYLMFRGGKGVATGFGVLVGLYPLIGSVLLMVWGVLVGLSRISSVGAIACFSLLPFIIWWFVGQTLDLIVASLLSSIVLIRHRTNIIRLWNGVEPKLGRS